MAIATAAAAIACTGRNDTVNNDRRVQSGGERGINQRLALEGCLEAAPGDKYVLRNVAEVPSAQQPQGADKQSVVARGSWVRLATGDADMLKSHLGKRVTVTGEVRDTGQNTIGTAGQESPMPRAGEANGNAPEIAVERVSEVEGGLCGQPIEGDSRRPGGRQ